LSVARSQLSDSTESGTVSSARVIVAASIGNALEWYDFIVFGFFAPQIAGAFFPHASLLLTFGTYGASFLARPIGAAVIGAYADNHGRRAALSLSIWLMAFGTLLMVVMPRYATIGAAASFGILGARLIQGFSAGGEFGGATALMIEHSPKRAGFYGSFQNTTQSMAAIAGSLVGWALSTELPHAALVEWGFRLPFVLGLLVAPVGLYVRRHVPEMARPPGQKLQASPLKTLLQLYPGRVLLGASTIAAGTASTYMAIYLPTYAQRHLHMAASGSFAATMAVACVPLLVIPVAGHFSDRRGRLLPMLWGSGALLLLSYPAFQLVVAQPTAMTLGCVLVVLVALRSAYAAPMPALLGEMFPVDVRGVGMSLSYTLGVIVFGGFAQLILEWLIERTGDASVPGYYLAATAAVTFAGLLVIRRTIKLYL
jgi:MHS family proline/betaine transporter-like MFS transporter